MTEIMGTSGNDNLFGTGGPDVIYGGDGDDKIDAGDGVDTLFGGAGNDFLQGGLGADRMEGGAGDDIYFIDNLRDSIVEARNEGRDTIYAYISYVIPVGLEIELLSAASFASRTALDLTGNEFSQTIFGNDGDNRLASGGGDDVLASLDGNDILDGGIGADIMDGGKGRNTFHVDNAGDRIFGDGTVYTTVDFVLNPGATIGVLSAASFRGTDPLSLTGNAYSQTIYGNDGNNRIVSGGGNDTLIGFRGDDTYYISSDRTIVLEGESNGGGGFDTAYTSVSILNSRAVIQTEVLATTYDIGVGLAIDLDLYSYYAQAIYGTDGRNTITSNTAWMFGFTGDDTYYVSGERARVFDSSGFDTVRASVSYSTDSSIEILLTNDWDSKAGLNLYGFGARQIYGNEGANILWGGALMAGMSGADTYRLARYDVAQTLTRTDILGFEVEVDRFELDHSLFPGLDAGTLDAGRFTLGTAVRDADDRLIYDTATGNLWFDADGTGEQGAVLFATVYERIDGGHPLLAAADFTVI